jgi:hypothetical protein
MPRGNNGSWKLERASVHSAGKRLRSNKYAKSDTTHERKPAPHERGRFWVGGYTRADGTKVKGHYRKNTT